MKKIGHKIVFNNKGVKVDQLIKNGYKFVLFDGRQFINIEDVLCLRRPRKNSNFKYVSEVTSISDIKDSIKAVYSISGQLIYKMNRHTGRLSSVSFVEKKNRDNKNIF